jgi:hypothetical protein
VDRVGIVYDSDDDAEGDQEATEEEHHIHGHEEHGDRDRKGPCAARSTVVALLIFHTHAFLD